jgi:RNA polymerase sigma factor (sigma-70 family)
VTPIICRIDDRAVSAAFGASENLSGKPFVWTGDMPLLALPVDARPADIAGPDANSARRAAFLDAARPSLDRVYRLAGLLLADAREAEDAVQDALVIAWRSFETLRETDKFDAWFDRILVNGCRDRLRRRNVVRFIPMDAAIDPAGRDPFQAFIERDALLAGLARLTPDERIVVVMRFWADLPLEAIAHRLDWPLGTVKSRLHRALERLRGALAADEAEATR